MKKVILTLVALVAAAAGAGTLSAQVTNSMGEGEYMCYMCRGSLQGGQVTYQCLSQQESPGNPGNTTCTPMGSLGCDYSGGTVCMIWTELALDGTALKSGSVLPKGNAKTIGVGRSVEVDCRGVIGKRNYTALAAMEAHNRSREIVL